MKINQLMKKYNIKTENDLCRLFEKYYNIYYILLYEDHLDYEKGDYLIVATPYLSFCDGDLNWGITIYKWDGTYSEVKPNLPKDSRCKVALKVKNRKEVLHATASKKPNIKRFLIEYIGSQVGNNCEKSL